MPKICQSALSDTRLGAFRVVPLLPALLSLSGTQPSSPYSPLLIFTTPFPRSLMLSPLPGSCGWGWGGGVWSVLGEGLPLEPVPTMFLGSFSDWCMVTVGGLLDTIDLSDESARRSWGQCDSGTLEAKWLITKDMAGSVTAHAPLLCCQEDQPIAFKPFSLSTNAD